MRVMRGSSRILLAFMRRLRRLMSLLWTNFWIQVRWNRMERRWVKMKRRWDKIKKRCGKMKRK
jgi:hypothetical protein